MEREQLLQMIDDFAKAEGISAATVGRKAVNDGKFVSRLRSGKRCWPETAEKVVTFIRRAQAEKVNAQ
jgi:hypothetical protein